MLCFAHPSASIKSQTDVLLYFEVAKILSALSQMLNSLTILHFDLLSKYFI